MTKKKNQKKIKLYLCTIYEDEPTPEMYFNVAKLLEQDNIELKRVWVKAGYFSHRHARDVQDKRQCEIRQLYVDAVPDGEWFLILDSDEAIGGALSNIGTVLAILNSDEYKDKIDYCMIHEIRPDFEIKQRPRLIRKREGLTYGTEAGNWKHDWINYIDHSDCYNGGVSIRSDATPSASVPDTDMYETHDPTHNCNHYNYIDVAADDRAWVLGFLYFNHYKNGYAMNVYGSTFEPPKNLVELVTTEEIAE